jgi:hypothetical protein
MKCVNTLKDDRSILEAIKAAQDELALVDAKRNELHAKIKQLKGLLDEDPVALEGFSSGDSPHVEKRAPESKKIALFRSLFRGREDVFPKRFESKRTDKKGYQPACRKEWIKGLCRKPRVKCGNCENQDFLMSARSFEIVARQSKARYLTGLSATVIRKDGHHPIIFMNCGPVRYRVDDKRQAAKRPFSHKVVTRRTNFRLPESIDAEDYFPIHETYAALIDDDERNKMIAEDVVSAVARGRFPVLLSERKDHLEILKDLLAGKVQHIITLKGGMGKRQRQAAMAVLDGLDGDAGKVILATGKYLGEGFDEQRLDTLFLTLPVSWKGVLSQYAGRLHRIHHAKSEVIIYDYADLEVPMLTRMYEKRLRGYKSMGYEVGEGAD